MGLCYYDFVKLCGNEIYAVADGDYDLEECFKTAVVVTAAGETCGLLGGTVK